MKKNYFGVLIRIVLLMILSGCVLYFSTVNNARIGNSYGTIRSYYSISVLLLNYLPGILAALIVLFDIRKPALNISWPTLLVIVLPALVIVGLVYFARNVPGSVFDWLYQPPFVLCIGFLSGSYLCRKEIS